MEFARIVRLPGRAGQVAVGHAVPPSRRDGQAGQRRALTARVAGAGQAELGGGVKQRQGERMRVLRLPDMHRAAGTVIVAGPALPVFRAAEVRQQALVIPASRARAFPRVVVSGMTAIPDHRVHRTAAAEHAPPGYRYGPAGHARARRVAVTPVQAAAVQRLPQRWVGDLGDSATVRAGLHQQYRDVRVLRQPGGQHAPGRARADDDVVVLGATHRRHCQNIAARHVRRGAVR